MTLDFPKLDDRQFQDLVDEAKKRIPHYCPEWTDHNVSDPGVTLVELFAWMTDILLYRLNQVPDLHYIKFMEMFGITMQAPVPAKAAVTFWLSKPQETPVLIPAGTEVASTQTETKTSIVFSTDKEFLVDLPQLHKVLSETTSSSGSKKRIRKHNLRELETGFKGVDVFSSLPQVDDALYFGFTNDLSDHILGLEMEFDKAAGAGSNPDMPPYIWEVSPGKDKAPWEPCYVDKEKDTIEGMNVPGQTHVHLPKMRQQEIDGDRLYWLRVRIKDITSQEEAEGMKPYEKSPRLRKLASVKSWGGTIPTTHAQGIKKEFLGRSDGSPGQRFYLQMKPILERHPGETLTVQVEGEEAPQIWTEVPDFTDSGAEDHHFTLDSVTGELRLGPAVRQPDGTVKLYGSIPPRNSNLIFGKYRYGGGDEGNAEAKVINTLKTAIPFIARVSNLEPAWGGLDAETLESAKMRAPALLRTKDRAVTEGDYEFLARQALPAAIGRVKCLQPRPAEAGRVVPGQVFILVIPRLPHPERRLEPDHLQLDEEGITTLTSYLDERRLLTTRLDVRHPAYIWVSVHVQLRAAPGADQTEIEGEVLSRLYRFLNPLIGGTGGNGWSFGRDLFISDVYQCLQGISDVQFIRGVEMFAANPGGERQGDPMETIDVLAHGVIASGIHEVTFV